MYKLFFALLIAGAAVSRPLFAATLSTWVAEWDAAAQTAPATAHAGELGTVWTRSLNLSKDLTAVNEVYTAPMEALVGAVRAAKGGRFGPVLHNADEGGFSDAAAAPLLGASPAFFKRLRELARERGWTAFNIDLESLSEASAERYEVFLDHVLEAFAGLDVRVSVCLHPKTSEPGDYEGSRFQKWKRLSSRKADFVIMAYDHAWSTSPPGPLAPASWVREVAKFALANFGAERTVIALPLYGYHWKRTASGGWNGVPELAPPLGARARGAGWKAASLAAIDGSMAKLGKARGKAESEAIAYDDSATLLLKAVALKKSGVGHFAFWRAGGETEELYRGWKGIAR